MVLSYRVWLIGMTLFSMPSAAEGHQIRVGADQVHEEGHSEAQDYASDKEGGDDQVSHVFPFPTGIVHRVCQTHLLSLR